LISSSQNVPVQTNGDDCGAFVCHFALLGALGQEISFNASDIPEIRKGIKEAILRVSIRDRRSAEDVLPVDAAKGETPSSPEEDRRKHGYVSYDEEDAGHAQAVAEYSAELPENHRRREVYYD